jgi:hypothetical protein
MTIDVGFRPFPRDPEDEEPQPELLPEENGFEKMEKGEMCEDEGGFETYFIIVFGECPLEWEEEL